MKRRFVCLLLAAALLGGCAGRASAPAAAPTPTPAPTPAPLATPAPVTAWADMTYEPLDLDAFRAGAERLTVLAGGTDGAALCKCYDTLYQQYVWAFTMSSLAETRNSLDVTDEVWARRRTESSAALSEAGNILATAGHAAVTGPLGELFTGHIGAGSAAYLAGYRPLSERELALSARRSELSAEYNARIAAEDTLTVTWGGEAWTFPRLEGADGAALPAGDYWAIRNALINAEAEQIAPLYQELLSVCGEMARLRGYDDCGTYLYAEEYGRDYTPDEARALFAEIKAVQARHAYDPAFSPVLNRLDEVAPLYTGGDALVAAAGELTRGLDPVFEEQWRYLVDNGLYDIGSGPERADLSATASLPAFNNGAFIFIRQYGTPDDVSAMVHELGHFTAQRTVPPRNWLTASDSLDLAEIHSSALELLTLRGYDDIYERGAGIARFSVLSTAYSSLVSNALYAEFELEAFDHPEMSARELGELYARLLREYGYGGTNGPDHGWMYTPHFFFGPGYVVSYAAATLASLQIWDAAETDYDRGLAIYLDILRAGSYDRYYTEVLQEAGLKSFAEPGTVAAVCDRTLEALQALEADILADEALAPAA